MRWLVLVVVAAAVAVPSASGFLPDPKDDLLEAIQLEEQALREYRRDRARRSDLLEQSEQALSRALRLPMPPSARDDARLARHNDREVLEEWDVGDEDPFDINDLLEQAIAAKKEALDDVRASEIETTGSKASAPTPVKPPTCRFSATRAIAGCTGTDFWELYVDRDARQARCTFRGPAGVLSVARPLFPGTFQTRTCRLTNRTKTVGGVVKRVVRAELRITVPPGGKAVGPKRVTVTASWR